MSKSDFKHVIKFVFFFLLTSFFLDKVVYFSINRISKDVYTGQSIGKLNHYLTIMDKVDLIIEGSSRANHNINPILITENSYNMGINGQKMASSSTLTKLLGDKKQTILYHISPNNLFNMNYIGDDIKSLSVLYNQNKIVKKEIDRLKQNNVFQNFYWTISYNNRALGIVRNYIKPKYDYSKYYGFDPLHVTDYQRKILEKILTDTIEPICKTEFQVNKIYDTRLNEIKTFCDNNNKTLIFYTSPIYNDKCNYDNIKIAQIMKKKGITYLDFTDYFIDNNSIEYWKDVSHLSNIGADKFSIGIKDTILNLIAE